MKQKLQNLKKQIMASFKQQLPETSKDVIAFCQDVIELAGQDRNNKNLIFAVARDMMQLDTRVTKKSKRHFVNSVRRSLTNAAAFQVLEAIKNEEKAKSTDGQ